MRSELPLDVRGEFRVGISTSNYQDFEVEGLYKKVRRWSAKVRMDDLLAMVEAKEESFCVQDEIVFSLRPFILFINVNFVSKRF